VKSFGFEFSVLSEERSGMQIGADYGGGDGQRAGCGKSLETISSGAKESV
jgi:hypothetical protein